MTAEQTPTSLGADSATGSGRALNPKVASALTRYRVAAFVVGVALLVFVAAMVLRYGFGMPRFSQVWGPIHGALYAIYVFIAFDLSARAKWRLTNLLKVLLAGCIPVLSFFTEAWVTRTMRAGERL